MNRQPSQLEHVFADRACKDGFLIHILPILRRSLQIPVSLASKPTPISQDIRARPHRALLHEVRHDIDPLPIPAQQPRPHLIPLIHANLPLEATHHGPQHDGPATRNRLPLLIQHQLLANIMLRLLNARLEEAAHEMRACDVQVGEVRAVRLVQVVVAFPEWGVRGRYHGQEE